MINNRKISKELFSRLFKNSVVRKIIFQNVHSINPNSIKYKWNQVIDIPLVMAGNGYYDQLLEYHKEFPLPYTLPNSFWNVLKNATIIGRLDIVRYYTDNRYLPKPYPVDLLVVAAQYNRIEIIDYLENYGSWFSGYGSFDHPRAFEVSPLSGNIELVKRLASKVQNLGNNLENALNHSASIGRIDIIEWITNQPNYKFSLAHFNDIYQNATNGGHLHVIKFLIDKYIPLIRNTNSLHLIEIAVKNNNLDIVKYLHSHSSNCNNMKIDSSSLYLLNYASNSSLEMLIWLHENRTEVCTTQLMDDLAKNGRLDNIKWLHKNRTEGCTFKAMDEAAINGHLDVVTWLHENRTEGCTKQAMDLAYSFDIINYLHLNRTEGCTRQSIDTAAKRGDLYSIKWLLEHRKEANSTYNYLAMRTAAENNHHEVFKFLYGQYQNAKTDGFFVDILYLVFNQEHYELFKWIYNERLSNTKLPPKFLDKLFEKSLSRKTRDFSRWLVPLYDKKTISDAVTEARRYQSCEHIYQEFQTDNDSICIIQ